MLALPAPFQTSGFHSWYAKKYGLVEMDCEELENLIDSWHDLIHDHTRKLENSEKRKAAKEYKDWVAGGGKITIAEAYAKCGLTMPVFEEPRELAPIKIGDLLNRIREQQN